MANMSHHVKACHLHYVVEDTGGAEVIYVAGPFSDKEVALDQCIELAHHLNTNRLEVYSQEVFLK